MSSEALDLSGAMRPRNTPAPYWAFFTKEEAAFWSCADRSREDFQNNKRLALWDGIERAVQNVHLPVDSLRRSRHL